MFANIKPVTVFPRGQAVILEALAIVTPNKGANVEWRLSNSSMQAIAQGLEAMQKEDYDQWGADDEYVFTWLAGKLGVEVTEVVEPPPPPDPEPAPEPGPGDFGVPGEG